MQEYDLQQPEFIDERGSFIVKLYKDVMEPVSYTHLADWIVHVFVCSRMHDRYIQLSTVQISIGAGLDFLHLSGQTQKA